MSGKFALTLLLCLSLLLLAGCGYNGTATTSTGSPATVTAVTAITPGATTTAAAVTPSTTPNAHSGNVTVQLSASGYHAHEAITVTISNGTAQTISFADHQSNCTVVLLQRQNTANWDSVNLCKLMTLTRLLSLNAGKSTTAILQASGTTWQTGTYRVAFGYSAGPDGSSGPATVAYSSVFQVS